VRVLMCLFLLLAACDPKYVPPAPKLDVFCLLQAGAPRTVALVSLTSAGQGYSAPDTWQNGVAGASVEVATGTSITLFQPAPDTAGYYSTESLAVVPGSTHRLAVTCPEGRVLGLTRVPGPFDVEHVSFDTLNSGGGNDSARIAVAVDLTPCRGAAAYDLVATCIYVSEGRSWPLEHWFWWSDSSRVRFLVPPRLSRTAGEWLLDTLRLTLFALDSNYQDYRRMQFESGCPDRLMHLDGGVGVFGSICVTDTTLQLSEGKRQPGRNRY
jgi:Domain of unknown function (DUF4249)